LTLHTATVIQTAHLEHTQPTPNTHHYLPTHPRPDLKPLQRQLATTTIFVTHDQAEAMTLADRIAVLDRGRLLQLGTPDELYNRPVSLFVAQFIGSPPMNILAAQVRDGALVAEGVWRLPLRRHVDAADVSVGIRPEAIALSEP